MRDVSLYEATVVSNDDPNQTGKIQIRIEPELTDVPENDLPWAVPFISEASGSTVQKQVFVVGSVVWVLVDPLWQRFYCLGNKYFEAHFSFLQVQSPLSALNVDATYTDLKFTLTGDGSRSFQNASTGDCGYLHSTGSYVCIKSDGSVSVDAPKADVNASGKNIKAIASQNVVVEAKGCTSIKSFGNLDISGAAITFSGGTTGGALVVDSMVPHPLGERILSLVQWPRACTQLHGGGTLSTY